MNPQTLIDKARLLKGEEGELTYNDLIGEELSDEDVARLHLALDDLQATVNRVVRAVDKEWVRRWNIRGNRGLEVDGYVVTASHTRTDEKCMDTFGVLSWLTENPLFIPAVVNPNSLKKASFPPAVRETFYEKVKVYRPEASPAAIPVEVLEKNKQKKELQG